MAIDPGAGTSRRTIMTAALGAAGAFAASAIVGAAPVSAAPNGNVQLGTGVGNPDNDSAVQTQVTGTTDGITTFSAVQAGSGTGLYGFTSTGTGVLAVGGSSGNGLDARSSNGTGAMGASYTGSGVYGYAGGTAAPAMTGPAAGVVARAIDTSTLALRVIGRATFSFSGTVTVAANQSRVTVTKAGVTASSLIIATPRTNRAGVYVQSAVPGAGKFTVHLNKKVSGATDVAYLILG
jgi:hypothetical protein